MASVAEEIYNPDLNQELIEAIERIEGLKAEIADLTSQITEKFNDLKNDGYNVPVIKRIISDRAKDPEALKSENQDYFVYAKGAGLITGVQLSMFETISPSYVRCVSAPSEEALPLETQEPESSVVDLSKSRKRSSKEGSSTQRAQV